MQNSACPSSKSEGAAARHCDGPLRNCDGPAPKCGAGDAGCEGRSAIAMKGDLWALAAAMLLANSSAYLISVLTPPRQLGGGWVAGAFRDDGGRG